MTTKLLNLSYFLLTTCSIALGAYLHLANYADWITLNVGHEICSISKSATITQLADTLQQLRKGGDYDYVLKIRGITIAQPIDTSAVGPGTFKRVVTQAESSEHCGQLNVRFHLQSIITSITGVPYMKKLTLFYSLLIGASLCFFGISLKQRVSSLNDSHLQNIRRICHELRGALFPIKTGLHTKDIQLAYEGFDRTIQLLSEVDKSKVKAIGYCDFSEFLREEIRLFDFETIKISARFDNLQKVSIDREQMSLFSKFLHVSLENAKEAFASEVEIVPTINTNMVTISLMDNGHGISRKVITQIESGVRISTKSYGTGFGLISIRENALKCNGRLSLNNRPNGTVVSLSIPTYLRSNQAF